MVKSNQNFRTQFLDATLSQLIFLLKLFAAYQGGKSKDMEIIVSLMAALFSDIL